MSVYDVGDGFQKRAEDDAQWSNQETQPLTIESFNQMRKQLTDPRVQAEAWARKIEHDRRLADFYNAFDWEKMIKEEPNICEGVMVSVSINGYPIIPPDCVESLERYRK